MNYDFSLLTFPSKFKGMYRKDTVLPLILLISEVLKISRAKVEAHFLKKTCICNEFLGQDAFGKCPKITENLSKCTVVRELCAQVCLFFITLYIFLIFVKFS